MSENKFNVPKIDINTVNGAMVNNSEVQSQSMQQPMQQPIQPSFQQPIEQPVQQPMQQQFVQPIQQPVQPIQQPIQQQFVQPIQQSVVQPIQQPIMQSTQQFQYPQPMQSSIDLNSPSLAQDVTNSVINATENKPITQEVITIANNLDISNKESIETFGQESAKNLSRYADTVLHSIETTKVESCSAMLVKLDKVMHKFDKQDFNVEKPKHRSGLMGKFFGKMQNSIENLFAKYHTIGDEIDSIYVELKQYEYEIKQSNKDLDVLFDKNIEYYEELTKYIQAGKLVIDNFKNNYLIPLQQKVQSGNFTDEEGIMLTNAEHALEMLEQRVYDLELAKNVALQTLPQIKLIEKGNSNLARKINSSFIITIPVFKQSLIQAITLKRQANQAEAMAQLDKTTNELLLRNAQNTAMQSKLTAQLANGSSIKIDTLEKTWQTIVQGIEETRQIEEQARQERISGEKRLEELQSQYEEKIYKGAKAVQSNHKMQ